MAITDLTGYIWFGNEVLKTTASGNRENYFLNYTYNGTDYTNTLFSIIPTGNILEIFAAQDWVYQNTYGGWNSHPRFFYFTGGTAATNVNFINWLDENGTLEKLPITDLTNYIWIGNNSLTFPSARQNYKLNYDYEGTSYVGSAYNFNLLDTNELYAGGDFVYTSNRWWRSNIFKFTGGTDIKNITLILWLSENGILIDNLKNYVWQGKATLSLPSTETQYTVNFRYDGDFVGGGYTKLKLKPNYLTASGTFVDDVSIYNNGRYYGGDNRIIFLNGSDVNLISWLYKNGTLTKFENLQGYVWNADEISVGTSSGQFTDTIIDYTSNGIEYHSIGMFYQFAPTTYRLFYSTTQTVSDGITAFDSRRSPKWLNDNYKTIIFTGGDTSKEDLITWLIKTGWTYEPIYNVNVQTSGSGDVELSRVGNKITLTATPNEHYTFSKFTINGTNYTANPTTLKISKNTTVVAYFDEMPKFRVGATTNTKNGSVYVSKDEVYAGEIVKLFARPVNDYIFVKWQDGDTSNPRNVEITGNITFTAEYQKKIETSSIYQYRCFVKNQNDLTEKPKAFMVVDTFTLKEDLLTNANSKIKVIEMADNVDNGDVICIYNPFGKVIYNGVITSIADKEITTSQMQSFYKGAWIYNIKSSATTLEQEVSLLLQDYADGKIYGSTYIDEQVAQRFGGITIDYVGTTEKHLPTDLDKDGNEQLTQYDMEQFIYKLYQDYGIVFEFEINLSGSNYVHIHQNTISSMKIGNNHYAIQELSPIQTIEETNRLIIYSKDKQYRTTFVALNDGTIEENPDSIIKRFGITNTKIIFSGEKNVDTDLPDLVASNLPTKMYDHKITFTLFLKNSLYEFNDFVLGMPLQIWYGTDYYGSVLTGRQIVKQSNQNVSFVDYTCGLVRTALTKKLTLGLI